MPVETMKRIRSISLFVSVVAAGMSALLLIAAALTIGPGLTSERCGAVGAVFVFITIFSVAAFVAACESLYWR